MRAVLHIPSDAAPAAIEAALQGLVAENVVLMRRRRFPPLYKSGVRYAREPLGREEWNDAQSVLDRARDGKGSDCEDLAGYLAGYLRAYGEDPGARVVITGGISGTYHAVVRRSDGSIEDPSKRLGMRPKGCAGMSDADYFLENVEGLCSGLGSDTTIRIPDQRLDWGFQRESPGVYRGWVTLPGRTVRAAVAGNQACVGFTVEGVGISPQAAMRAATGTARAILSNPLVQSVLPPGTMPMLKAMNRIARAVGKKARGFFRKLFHRRRSRTPKQLALRKFAMAVLPALQPPAEDAAAARPAAPPPASNRPPADAFVAPPPPPSNLPAAAPSAED